MSNEERARIARENGAKSHGPTTDAGKAKVSANAVKTGEHIDKLARDPRFSSEFVPYFGTPSDEDWPRADWPTAGFTPLTV